MTYGFQYFKQKKLIVEGGLIYGRKVNFIARNRGRCKLYIHCLIK